jgi:hypothetical protein
MVMDFFVAVASALSRPQSWSPDPIKPMQKRGISMKIARKNARLLLREPCVESTKTKGGGRSTGRRLDLGGLPA